MNDLQIFNRDIIPVYTTDTGERVVKGREMYDRLGVTERYSKWFDRMAGYGFACDTDYTPYQTVHPQNGQKIEDHFLKFDMAKHIAMIQRSEIGFQIRQKLIELEKKATLALPIDYAAALRALADEVESKKQLEHQNAKQAQLIGELKPKADYLDQILRNKGLVTTTAIAKDYGMSGSAFNKLLHSLAVQYNQSGQWLLYAKYHSMGYTHSETVNITHKDGTPDIKMHTRWTQKGRLFLYELLKGNGILPMIEQEAKAS